MAIPRRSGDVGFRGGLVGALLGAAAAVEIAWNAGWPILVSPWAIVLACGFAAFVGIVFGLYPARQAARFDPIVAPTDFELGANLRAARTLNVAIPASILSRATYVVE